MVALAKTQQDIFTIDSTVIIEKKNRLLLHVEL